MKIIFLCINILVCQSPVRSKVRKQSAQIRSTSNTSVENSTMVSPGTRTSEDYPWRIPQQTDLVSMPVGQEFLMQQGVPQLIAWPISGNHMHHKEFLCRVQTSCLHHGGTKPTPTMAPLSLSGLAGVSGGVEIPYRNCRGCSKFLG